MPLTIPAPREAGYTTTTGVPLYWAAYGPVGAPRALVLHGGPGADHRYLLPQMLRLAEHHDLLFYDQRGGGQSRTDARDPVTWRDHVRDLGQVIGEFGLAQPTVVAYSWGGLLAMLYAVETTTVTTTADLALGQFGRLALIDPAAVTREYRAQFEAEFARRSESDYVRAERAALLASGRRESDPAAYRQRAFELSVAGYFADPTNARDLTPFRVVARIQHSVWDSLDDYDLLPALERVRARATAPMLVVHGREDPIPLASSVAATGALGARLVILEHCGHVPYVERPEPLFAALEQFLMPNSAPADSRIGHSAPEVCP